MNYIRMRNPQPRYECFTSFTVLLYLFPHGDSFFVKLDLQLVSQGQWHKSRRWGTLLVKIEALH